jgi:hypothetical protein
MGAFLKEIFSNLSTNWRATGHKSCRADAGWFGLRVGERVRPKGAMQAIEDRHYLVRVGTQHVTVTLFAP